MTKEEKIDFAVQVMKKFAENQELKLARGARLRSELREAIKRGQAPKGYRADWLRDSGYQLLRVLSKIANKFDREHPDDRASVSDLMDILNTAQFLLKKQLKSLPGLNDTDKKDD